MSLSVWLLVLSGMLAQGPGAAPDAVPEETTEEPPSVLMRMAAIQASAEGRSEPYVDKELDSLKGLLTALPFDTFKKVAVAEQECPPGQETTLPIDDRFACVVRPELAAQAGGAPGAAPGGALKLDAKVVDQNGGGGPLVALAAVAEMPMNQTILFRDIPRDSGRLLVLLTPAMNQPQQQQQDQQQQEQQNEQQQDQEEQQEQQDQEDQNEPQPDKENEDKQAQAEEASLDEESEGEQQPKEQQNIEALLEALEQQDKREQKLLRDAPVRREMQREWW